VPTTESARGDRRTPWASKEEFAKHLGVINIAQVLPQALAPGVAGALVVLSGGYWILFPAALLLSILGGLAVLPIRSVR
jgi:hypothetical protein